MSESDLSELRSPFPAVSGLRTQDAQAGPKRHHAGCASLRALSGCSARNTGRLPGQRYEIFRSMRPVRQNSERSLRQNGVHPPGKPAKVRNIHPPRQYSIRPSRQNCGGTRRQDARSRPPGRIPPHRSYISARRNLRRHRAAGPDAADATRFRYVFRSAFVAAKQGPNRRLKDSVLQKKRSGAIWSDKSQVFFKIF